MKNALMINVITEVVKDVSNSVLMPFYEKVQAQNKPDGSLVTQADIAVQHAFEVKLAEKFPQFGFFAEELPEGKLNKFFTDHPSGYWVLDPLDGTSNFASALPFFAISLALIVNNKILLGVVFDPIRNECFTAITGEGAFLNNEPLSHQNIPNYLNECIAMIDFKRLPSSVSTRLVTTPPYRSQRSIGTAALEWCWLAAGRNQLYLHGKHMLWDYAAGLLIAQEAGCVTSDFTGKPVFQASMDSRTVLAAVDKSLHKQWLDYISN